jgi:hypothetical protein
LIVQVNNFSAPLAADAMWTTIQKIRVVECSWDKLSVQAGGPSRSRSVQTAAQIGMIIRGVAQPRKVPVGRAFSEQIGLNDMGIYYQPQFGNYTL